MSDSFETLVQTLEQWSIAQINHTQRANAKGQLIPLPGDASARRYYRIYSQEEKSYIVVHSPPEGKNHAFINIAQSWLTQGVRTPVVFSADLEQGFLLLEDLGLHTLLHKLPDTVTTDMGDKVSPYLQAMSVLYRIQTTQPPENLTLPRFDAAFMHREMDLFTRWVVTELLQRPEKEITEAGIDLMQELLIGSALEQPQTIMHRDYHSRNLMPMQDGLGVLDFQDTVIGPVTYDIVSLLRDCYIDWPQAQVYQWLNEFASYTPLLKKVDRALLHRWFDWMGLQRHLKVAGIFVRQWLENDNDFYLQDIPRVFSYILYVCSRYSELSAFHTWLKKSILPGLELQSWWSHHRLEE